MNIAQKTKLYTEMYNLYYPRLLRNMPKLTFDFEEREDICQETFQRVWQALVKNQYDELAHPFTWIYKIAIGASQRLLQTKQRQLPTWYTEIGELQEFDPAEESELEDDPAHFSMDHIDIFDDGLVDYNTPEVVLMREQREAQMDEQVHDLPAHWCELVTMYYYDGMTYAEIAKRNNITEDVVRGILRRARDQLKILLGEKYESDTIREETSPESYEGRRGGVR